MNLKYLYDELGVRRKNALRAEFLSFFNLKTQMSFYNALKKPSVTELDFFLQKFGLTYEAAKQKIAELQNEQTAPAENFGLVNPAQI